MLSDSFFCAIIQDDSIYFLHNGVCFFRLNCQYFLGNSQEIKAFDEL